MPVVMTRLYYSHHFNGSFLQSNVRDFCKVACAVKYDAMDSMSKKVLEKFAQLRVFGRQARSLRLVFDPSKARPGGSE